MTSAAGAAIRSFMVVVNLHFLFIFLFFINKYGRVIELNVFVKTVMHLFQDYLINRMFKRTAFVCFDEFNASLQKLINLFEKILSTPNF